MMSGLGVFKPALTSGSISIKLTEDASITALWPKEIYVSITRFAFAGLCFTLISLSFMFGIAFTMGKFMVPPSSLDTFVKNILGTHGPLIVYITLSVLGTGLAFLVTKKFFFPKAPKVKKES